MDSQIGDDDDDVVTKAEAEDAAYDGTQVDAQEVKTPTKAVQSSDDKADAASAGSYRSGTTGFSPAGSGDSAQRGSAPDEDKAHRFEH